MPLNHPSDKNSVPAIWRVVLICGVITVLLRLPTFFRSVLDWDESLYALMAGQILAGHLPYTTIWDNKPVGIYVIFAAFGAFIQNPVVAMRVATVVACTSLAALVWRLAYIFCADSPAPSRPRLAWLAALSFILGALSNDGLAANTEIFMEGFSAAAILAAIDPEFCARRPLVRAMCTGILFSLAVMTKYVAVFEAPALAFALLGGPMRFRGAAARAGAAFAGACLAPALVVAIYAAAGDVWLWWSCSIASNVTRVAVPFSASRLQAVALTILPCWTPAIAASVWLLASWPMAKFPAGRWHLLLALWLAGGVLGVVSAKSFYDHYFLQILPPACLALAVSAARFAPVWASAGRAFAFTAALLLIPGIAGYQALAAIIKPLEAGGDTPRRVAAMLRPDIKAGASLYVFDSQPILYALTKAAAPTRFVLPSVLTRCFLAGVAGVNPTREVARVLRTDPTYIIRSPWPPASPDDAVYAELNADLAARYALTASFTDAEIFHLRPDAPKLPPPPLPDSCPAQKP